MILECSYCGGRMRVEEDVILAGRGVRVRCPHCKGIGITEHEDLPDTFKPLTGPSESRVHAADGPAPWQQGWAPRHASADQAAQGLETALPADAFKDFRFPSEEVARRPHAATPNRKKKIIWFIGASLGTVLFFTALVNIILRGPAR